MTKLLNKNKNKLRAQEIELVAHSIAMRLVTNGAQVLRDKYEFTEVMVREWAEEVTKLAAAALTDKGKGANG